MMHDYQKQRKGTSTISLALICLLCSQMSRGVSAKWDSQVCVTGAEETIAYDETGNIYFIQTGGRHRQRSLSGHDRNVRYTTSSTFDNNMYNPSTTHSSAEMHLLDHDYIQQQRQQHRFHWKELFLSLLSPSTVQSFPSFPTLSWNGKSQTTEHHQPLLELPQHRQLQQQQQQLTVQNATTFQARACLCNPSNLEGGFYENVNLYLCPASADYCGASLTDGGPVGCFSISVQQIVARNAWPMVILWYLGLLVICSCTIHGRNCWHYFLSCFYPSHNHTEAQRLLDAGERGLRRPNSKWNCVAWQRYRFEHNLVLQSNWIWRQREYIRQQTRRAQGLPPPRYEIKTTRFMREDYDQEQTPQDNSRPVRLAPESNEQQQIHVGDVPTCVCLECPDPEMGGETNANANAPTLETSTSAGTPSATLQQQEVQELEDIDEASLHEPSCTICFVPLEDGDIIGDLACKHLYHKACLKIWCSRKNACPLCNAPIAKRQECNEILDGDGGMTTTAAASENGNHGTRNNGDIENGQRDMEGGAANSGATIILEHSTNGPESQPSSSSSSDPATSSVCGSSPTERAEQN